MIPDPDNLPRKADSECADCLAPAFLGAFTNPAGHPICLKCFYLDFGHNNLVRAISCHGTDGELCQRHSIKAFDALVCVGPMAHVAHDSIIAAFTAVEEGRVIGDSPAAKGYLTQALAEVKQAILIRTAHRRYGTSTC